MTYEKCDMLAKTACSVVCSEQEETVGGVNKVFGLSIPQRNDLQNFNVNFTFVFS